MHPSPQPLLLLEFREAEDPASKPWFPPLEHQISVVWDVAWALGFQSSPGKPTVDTCVLGLPTYFPHPEKYEIPSIK